ncbi:MAG: alpha/beta hydrolase [Leptolyngbyaceae cyanobacterium bins.349]|nr:alpha/beta hydrolase [Leptolyngbyaceae cyanobacterium bins.349]
MKKWMQRVGLGAIAVASAWAIAPAANAADEIVFRYGILRQKLSTVELTKFAETGEQSPVLERYLRRANANPEEVRQILNQSVDITPTTLDKGLNNVVGNLVLDELGKMIQTPNDEGNREALRSALIASTEKDNKLTILELIQNYPANEIHLDVMRAIKTYNRIARYQQPLQDALQKAGPLRQILKQQGITLPDFLK